MTAVTETLSEFVAGLKFESIPDAAMVQARRLFFDLMGVMIRGQTLDSTLTLKAGLRDLGLSGGEGKIVGAREPWSVYAAALINGAAAHSLDFDDTHAKAEIHPGAPVISAALAAAQLTNAGTRELLTGIVAGYEVMCRVAEGLTPTARPDRGFHVTGIAGVFGAAAAAGNILRLAPVQMANAFGTALSQAAGSRQFFANGAWTKRFHVGNAAAGGLTAASLARHDYTGAAEALEGKCGFLTLYSAAPRPEAVCAGLGETWEILAVGIKPYPCCRAIHAALDAVQHLMSAHDISVPRIRSVGVGLAQKSFDLTCAPQAAKRSPVTSVDCQFSTHFCIASMLKLGRVSFDDYEASLSDPDIKSLMRRVECHVDPQAEAEYPVRFSGQVEVILDDGQTLSCFVRTPSGEPENMLTEMQLMSKFSALVSSTLGADGEKALFDGIHRMTEDYPVEHLLDLTQPHPVQRVRALGGA